MPYDHGLGICSEFVLALNRFSWTNFSFDDVAGKGKER